MKLKNITIAPHLCENLTQLAINGFDPASAILESLCDIGKNPGENISAADNITGNSFTVAKWILVSFFFKFKPINHLIPFSSLVTQLTATALENLVVYVVQDLKQVVYDSEGRWFDPHLLSLLQSPWERCWGVALKSSFLPVQGIWQIFQDGEMICGFVVLIS